MATKNQRIVNYLIDSMIIIILTNILNLVLVEFSIVTILYGLVFFFYYFFMELSLGQTVGKFTTNTIVRTTRNEKAHFGLILMRTLARFNPYDVFSYLLGKSQGTHDVISRTRLYRKN